MAFSKAQHSRAKAKRERSFDLAILRRTPEGLDKLEIELREVIAKFVDLQPPASRAFAKKLAETATFKSLLETMAIPKEHWPGCALQRRHIALGTLTAQAARRWLSLFDSYAVKAT